MHARRLNNTIEWKAQKKKRKICNTASQHIWVKIRTKHFVLAISLLIEILCVHANPTCRIHTHHTRNKGKRTFEWNLCNANCHGECKCIVQVYWCWWMFDTIHAQITHVRFDDEFLHVYKRIPEGSVTVKPTAIGVVVNGTHMCRLKVGRVYICTHIHTHTNTHTNERSALYSRWFVHTPSPYQRNTTCHRTPKQTDNCK